MFCGIGTQDLKCNSILKNTSTPLTSVHVFMYKIICFLKTIILSIKTDHVHFAHLYFLFIKKAEKVFFVYL